MSILPKSMVLRLSLVALGAGIIGGVALVLWNA